MKNAVLVDFKQLEFGSGPRPNSPKAAAARHSNFGRRFPPERQEAIKKLIVEDVVPEEESQVSTQNAVSVHSVPAKKDGGHGLKPDSQAPAQLAPRTATMPSTRRAPQPPASQGRLMDPARNHARIASLPRFFRQIQKQKLNEDHFKVLQAVQMQPNDLAVVRDQTIQKGVPRVSLVERQSDANAAARALMGMASKINASKIYFDIDKE